jgi:hypothetical protein
VSLRCVAKKTPNLGVRVVDEKASLITGSHSVPEEANLAKVFSTFPNGWPGIVLFFCGLSSGSALRFKVHTISTRLVGATVPTTWVIGLAAIFCWRCATDRFPHPFRRCGGDQQFSDRDLPTCRIRSDTAQGVYRSRVSRDVHCCRVLGPGAFSLDEGPLEVTYLRTTSPKPDPQNPRVHSDKQVRQIAQSIGPHRPMLRQSRTTI